ncbi:hypothetical protein N9O57_01510 [bacterium]|nr:hypothetical protein [bacterium]
MKFLFAVVFVLSYTTYSFGDTSSGTFKVEANLDYAVINSNIACVVKYYPDSEGEEDSELFFLDKKSYLSYRSLVKEGYRVMNRGSLCRSTINHPINVVAVGVYDKTAKILKEIDEQKGAFEGRVILFNQEQFLDDIEKQEVGLIKRLTE